MPPGVYVRTEEYRAAVSVRMMGNKNQRGRKKSAETRAKISVANARHGQSRPPTPTYRSWEDMLKRCTNPNRKDWKYYGGRTPNPVRIEDTRWVVFEHFFADMGERPPGRTLDRKNNDLGYFKENCRWATWSQQNKNKRRRRRRT